MLKCLRYAPDSLFKLEGIDIQNSKTSEPEDKKKILTTVMNDIGFDNFNISLSEVIQKQIETVVLSKFQTCFGVNVSFLRELKCVFNNRDMYEIKNIIKPISKKCGAFIDYFHDNTICLDHDFKLKYSEFVEDATIFVSYPWSIEYSEFLDAIETYLILNQLKETETYFYIDLVCREQFLDLKISYKYHDWVDITACRFKNLSNSLTIVGPTWEQPTLFERLWLLFEIQVARFSNANIQFSSSNREQKRFLDFILSNNWDHICDVVTKEIDINKCKCTEKFDYDFIMNYFHNSKDGIEGLVDFIALKRLEWMIRILEMSITLKTLKQKDISKIENRLLKLYRLHFKPSRQLSC